MGSDMGCSMGSVLMGLGSENFISYRGWSAIRIMGSTKAEVSFEQMFTVAAMYTACYGEVGNTVTHEIVKSH